MISALRFCCLLRTAAAAILTVALSCSRGTAAPPPSGDLPPNLDTAVGNGLAYLAKQQQADGSFETTGPRLATSGLALMSFLAAGHTPDLGRYGLVVRNGIDFLIAQTPEDGYFGKVDGSRMYGHGIVTLALAEAYGVESSDERRAKLRAALIKAAGVIVTAQNVPKPDPFIGGWRYEPAAADSDLSLSGWNALALRACQDAGLNVPKDAVKNAASFVAKCYRPDLKAFAYQPGGDVMISSNAVGMLSLYLLDAGERPELTEAAKYLTANLVADATRFPYYSLYYTTQAALQAGDLAWEAVSKPALAKLFKSQLPDGGWPANPSGEEPGRIYATSMATLTLSVPYRLLPIYQR